MSAKILHSDNAPAAIGPYSQGIEAGGTVYVSGQLPVNPETGVLIDGGIGIKTKRCLSNIEAVLASAGCDLSNVVKVGVFLKSMKDFPAMNEAYAEMFGDTKPARSCVQVAALPKDADIEIECIAVK